MELTILMPCLNEAATLATCIRKARGFLQRSRIDGEVLVADNGSSDGSPGIAEAEGARVVHVANKGYGAALICGTNAASGRFVIMADSDDSYDFERLDRFVDELRSGSDLVIGNRFKGGVAPGAMPALHRYLGNPVLSFAGRLLFGSPVRDFHCGLRGFKRESILALNLNCTGMEYASEMIVKATLNGLNVTEVPTTLSPDGRGRPPHLRSWRDGWRHLRFLLIHAPLWLFLYPGILIAGAGLAGMCAIGIAPVEIGAVTLDIHTMLYAMVMFNAGLQMTFFAGASITHAVRIGMLPQMPARLQWIDRVTLENNLLAAVVLALVGLALAAASVWEWARVGFGGADPRQLMRMAIPAASLMLTASQVFSSAFLLEFVRLTRSPATHHRADRNVQPMLHRPELGTGSAF